MLAGVSSPHLTGSAASAVVIAVSNPAAACPNGTAAVVVVRQQPHLRRGKIQQIFSSSIGGTSQICVQLAPRIGGIG